MFSIIAKWGNSLAIRIPQNIAKEIDLAEGSEVKLDIVDGNLVLKPKKRSKYTLNQLVEEITPDNLHDEMFSL
ncbi:transcriptional regulator/antitoxin, MazE [Calothrix parasitica NIES-267]|uniref:Transcriptional regulator/antitoxin, MazE n=1 Tax=Calothrix parasitica NIES-267 TaxID=1973488 RepID=A0A1Z4LNA6_9CYAN|nr:transcriptional regulator/antitoxin, MazE [Calothrix parasitica NIES-267]